MAFASMRTQYWPPAPTFTEKDVTAQTGRVFIVTGGNQGVGLELIKMLYPTGATIYMASRSKERAEAAIKNVVSTDASSASRLKFLHLDLDDLATVRSAAKSFSDQESRLDILWNNAGIGGIPAGSKTKQGIESFMGINVVGPFLFTQLLLPNLKAAAASAPKNSVRIVWTSSWMMEGKSPPGGYNIKDLENGGSKSQYINYATSKAANRMIAHEAGQRYGKDGIISICQNPGNLQTHIYNGQPRLMMFSSICFCTRRSSARTLSCELGSVRRLQRRGRARILFLGAGYWRLIRERIFMMRWRMARGRSCGSGVRYRLKRIRKMFGVGIAWRILVHLNITFSALSQITNFLSCQTLHTTCIFQRRTS